MDLLLHIIHLSNKNDRSHKGSKPTPCIHTILEDIKKGNQYLYIEQGQKIQW